MNLTPDALALALAAHAAVEHPALPGRTNHRRAGVLVPLVWEEGAGPVCLLELRPATLRRHAGEVCFPGGRPEPGDEDLLATALREAAEELGLTGARPLGRLSSVPLFTSEFRLVPFVAEVPPQPLRPDPGEVARALRLPLAEVFALEAIDAIPYTLPDGEERLSPVFQPEGEVMYGATAHAFHELLQLAARAAGLALPPLRPGRYAWEDVLR